MEGATWVRPHLVRLSSSGVRLLRGRRVLRRVLDATCLEALAAVHPARREVGLENETVPHGRVSARVLADDEEDEAGTIREEDQPGEEGERSEGLGLATHCLKLAIAKPAAVSEPPCRSRLPGECEPHNPEEPDPGNFNGNHRGNSSLAMYRDPNHRGEGEYGENSVCNPEGCERKVASMGSRGRKIGYRSAESKD